MVLTNPKFKRQNLCNFDIKMLLENNQMDNHPKKYAKTRHYPDTAYKSKQSPNSFFTTTPRYLVFFAHYTVHRYQFNVLMIKLLMISII